MTQRRVLIALGANLSRGSSGPTETLHAALGLVAQDDFRLAARSELYRTPAFRVGSAPDFVNAVAVFMSELSPNEILGRLHDAEATLGRERATRWGARVIDLDLLAVGDLVRPGRAEQKRWMALSPVRQREVAPDRLILPHPRLQDRAFVLVPLCDIAPDWRHPVLGRSAAELRDALNPDDVAAIRVASD